MNTAGSVQQQVHPIPIQAPARPLWPTELAAVAGGQQITNGET